MEDISGFGMEIRLIASLTFPAGFTLTEFSDDTDPFDLPDLTIADGAMGLNGDLVVWSSPNPIQVTLSLIPDGPDDKNMAALAEAARIGKGKLPILDKIIMTRSLPGASPITLINGKLITMPPGSSVATGGRKKSKNYTFMFENKVGA